MTGRTLVAGVGNVFLGDDGFGVEVVRALSATSLPDDVEVADYGIRGVHLAYALVDGFDELVLVDACARGGEPGTLYVLEPGPPATGDAPPAPAEPAPGVPMLDGHGMEPDAVLALLGSLAPQLGGTGVRRVRVVGCEPQDTDERMGLSAPVAAAVPGAVRLVHEILSDDDGDEGAEGASRADAPHDRSWTDPTSERGRDDHAPGEGSRGGHGGGGGRAVAAGHREVPAHAPDVTVARAEGERRAGGA